MYNIEEDHLDIKSESKLNHTVFFDSPRQKKQFREEFPLGTEKHRNLNKPNKLKSKSRTNFKSRPNY